MIARVTYIEAVGSAKVSKTSAGRSGPTKKASRLRDGSRQNAPSKSKHPAARATVDWQAVEPHYCAGILSLREMASAHGVSHAAIIKHAKAHGWIRDAKPTIKTNAGGKHLEQRAQGWVNATSKSRPRTLVEIIEERLTLQGGLTGDHEDLAAARDAVKAKWVAGPWTSNARLVRAFGRHASDTSLDGARAEDALVDCAEFLAQDGMGGAQDLLAAQAVALNCMFVELGARAASHLGTDIDRAERYARLALKAQANCRVTLQTISDIKHPAVIFARQANVANGGPQQVNNGVPARATKSISGQNELLEVNRDNGLDITAQSEASSAHSTMAPMGEIDGAKDGAGQGEVIAQRVQRWAAAAREKTPREAVARAER
jgi:hypothetical protein